MLPQLLQDRFNEAIKAPVINEDDWLNDGTGAESPAQLSPPCRRTTTPSPPTTTSTTSITSTRSTTPGTAPQEGIDKTLAEEKVRRGLQSSMEAISNELGRLLSVEQTAFIRRTLEEQLMRLAAELTTGRGTLQASDRLHKRGRSSASSSSGDSPEKSRSRTLTETQIPIGDDWPAGQYESDTD